MKLRKVLASVLASAVAVSAMAVTASAENYTATLGFADGTWAAQDWATTCEITGDGTYSITSNCLFNVVDEETGVEFFVYDNVYVDETEKAHKYVPDNTVVFLPNGDLGKTHIGVTPEESDLMATGVADVAIVNSGIAVTNSIEVDPVKAETKVSMVALPSFERANEVVILDTEK